MGDAGSEIDAWLHAGGLVVTASDRAARALVAEFHRRRLLEGLSAWPAPKILDWRSFVCAAWLERASALSQSSDARLLLNPSQEQSLWAEIVAQDHSQAALLDGPRHRLALLAMEAHELLCNFAPRYLLESERRAWQQDAAAFSRWLTIFDERCRSGDLLSPSRLPLELMALLQADHNPDPEQKTRQPLLLAGFDRILPTQRNLFDAWGAWRVAETGAPAAIVHFYEAASAQTELAACALWCGRRLQANPDARLLVVVQAASARRGEIERAFLQYTAPAASPLFEFSLGIPLSQITFAKAAHLALRWLAGPIAEQELDWLLSTGHVAASPEESVALELYVRTLRRSKLERPQWTLAAFLGQRLAAETLPAPGVLPASWISRMTAVERRLAEFSHRSISPLDWAELVPRLLDELRFASSRVQSSAEFQATSRWRQAVDACGSLGFDGRRIGWSEFLSQLRRTLDETLFAPESHEAPIQIAGPAESAGLAADAVWFLGADEDSWPARGATHPLLPVEIQRETGMPHGTPQLDWELAHSITARLLASGREVHFSFARQNEAVEARPSRLIVQFAGVPLTLPPELGTPAAPLPLTVSFEDTSRVLFSPGKAAGGSSILTTQSQCPFKAFATARLGAQGWTPAEAGLTAAERGSLLHAVLHAVWAGAPDGIRTQADLQNPATRKAIAGHVKRVLEQELRPHLRKRLPRRYLELEGLRLTRLVSEWLDYEATRIEFEVIATELKRSVAVAGLALDLRLDRVDRLRDGSQLVIDYKTGDVSPNSWELPRPEDVQLPLYAGFALDKDEVLGGLVFAKVRPGGMSFAGRVGDAAATLFSGLKGNNALMKNPLAVEQLLDWRDCIEQLARDFLAGRAEVDPRDYPKTCERCELQSLCRIREFPPLLDTVDEADSLSSVEAGDE